MPVTGVVKDCGAAVCVPAPPRMIRSTSATKFGSFFSWSRLPVRPKLRFAVLSALRNVGSFGASLPNRSPKSKLNRVNPTPPELPSLVGNVLK